MSSVITAKQTIQLSQQSTSTEWHHFYTNTTQYKLYNGEYCKGKAEQYSVLSILHTKIVTICFCLIRVRHACPVEDVTVKQKLYVPCFHGPVCYSFSSTPFSPPNVMLCHTFLWISLLIVFFPWLFRLLPQSSHSVPSVSDRDSSPAGKGEGNLGGADLATPTPHCTTLHYFYLHYPSLHCTAPHCTSLHFTAPHCTALHCTALHWLTLIGTILD